MPRSRRRRPRPLDPARAGETAQHSSNPSDQASAARFAFARTNAFRIKFVGSHHHIAALQKPHSSGCFRAQSDFGRSCCSPLMARSLRIFQKTGLWRGVQRARARQR
jgi:hypothetical protein